MFINKSYGIRNMILALSVIILFDINTNSISFAQARCVQTMSMNECMESVIKSSNEQRDEIIILKDKVAEQHALISMLEAAIKKITGKSPFSN